MNKIIKSLIILLFVGIIIPLFFIKVDADEGFDESIFNNANTYNLGVSLQSNHYKFTFDKNNKNDNVVEESPSVTFFTHGLSGTAADLSRDTRYEKNTFGYSESSILNALHNKVDSNIYLFKFTNSFNYEIYKIEGDTSYTFTKINHITDASKHSLVCFNGYNTSDSNDYVYSQFNIMASVVLSDLKEAKSGVLPKVNLIGHSRGGLTNLQYALDHPDLVDSIYSLNSPYFGTTIATIDYNLTTGEPLVDNPGIESIQSVDTYMTYYNRWNDNYETLYKNIKCHAIGMYQNLELALYQLFYSIISNISFNEATDYIIYSYLAVIAKMAHAAIHVIEWSKGFTRYMANQEGKNALDKLISELYFDKTGEVLEFDGLVDLDSQLAKKDNYSYKGFNRLCYKLTIIENRKYSNTARGGIAVTHAVAPFISDVVEYIKDTITL